MRSQDKDVKGFGRTVRGQVSSSGGIVQGSGFTVAVSGAQYSITFSTPFRSPPVVVATTKDGAIVMNINSQPTQSGFTCNPYNSNTQASMNAGFHFIAIEANPA